MYIDNSNIFINAQQHAATMNKLQVLADMRCRIDVGKLVTLACKGRNALCTKLYGSEPSALDTVWSAIRNKSIEVILSKRSEWNNREKEIDTSLTADAVEDLIELKNKAGPNRAMILFSGDKDMLPALKKALKHGWFVEIWSFEAALSNGIQKFEKSYKDSVKIHLIEDCFKNVTYTGTRWDPKRVRIPADRTMVLG